MEEPKPQRTTDERIDAIAMNLELLGHDVRQTTANVDRILSAVESLVQIVHSHERRLSNLEGRQGQ